MASSPALAFDYSSVRVYDRDGRLRVSHANISASRVNPYNGYEIPGSEKLGLDPNRVYMLWRHPEELAKAAKSFNNVPLLSKHVPANADDHKPNDVVGATGSDAAYFQPFLTNSLVIWAGPSIRAVEDGSQRELSCCYFYKPEMKAGVTPDGEAYDGTMRSIVGSHVALVERGRAGSDVLVGDGKILSCRLPSYYYRSDRTHL